MRLFVLLTCLTGAILAHAFNINGIEYEPSDESTVSIKSVSPSLTQIIIPEVVSYGGADYTVTTIKSRAFNSANLTSLTLPGTIVRIEDYAFNSASSLKELILLDGSSPLNIGISKHSTYYNEGMFRHTPLTTLYLGREYFTTYYNEKVLGYDANPFYAIKSLKNVTIGDVKNPIPIVSSPVKILKQSISGLLLKTLVLMHLMAARLSTQFFCQIVLSL